MGENRDTPEGLGFAVGAYAFWGFLPIYLKWLDHIPALEVVAHRIIWSLPVAGGVLIALGRTDTLRAALRDPRALAMAAGTATLISINWAVYVYAIASGQAVQAALGYYINPLFSVLIGAVFTLRHTRFGKTGLMVLSAVLAGFVLYFISSLTHVMGENGQVPIALAVWAPPIAAILLAMSLLLHLEDG